MTHSRPTPARRRIDAALDGLASTFRGMTAHPDDGNCQCHWGSAEELALLKTPDVELHPEYAVLPMLVTASRTLGRWLDAWASASGPVADRRLAESFAEWEYDLLGDELPWDTWETTDDEDVLRAELTDCLLRHAPARLRAVGAGEELSHRMRLLGLTGPVSPPAPR
ncbi:hypothetical protein [Micromonospora sp. IBHARD004]|uniref:hypothetical protein n=1 Tax=Micromonospora sp. IBHARD004 TaxID=3457764 RepID=UPI00405852DD